MERGASPKMPWHSYNAPDLSMAAPPLHRNGEGVGEVRLFLYFPRNFFAASAMALRARRATPTMERFVGGRALPPWLRWSARVGVAAWVDWASGFGDGSSRLPSM